MAPGGPLGVLGKMFFFKKNGFVLRYLLPTLHFAPYQTGFLEHPHFETWDSSVLASEICKNSFEQGGDNKMTPA